MVRGGWCEKMGLKKGAWSGEEDEILISYIQAHGHSNWRALPKLAGLLRCGKSCRLRWTNYLRPDIKRGNFSAEEEHTIFNLHQILGNRWSAIAARLPGRTDNEIKNVWHTHLKKRLPLPPQSQHNHNNITPKLQIHSSKTTHPLIKLQTTTVSPTQSQSSSDTDLTTTNVGRTSDIDQALDEDFWSEVLSADDSPSQIPHFQFSTPTVCHGFSFDFCFHAGLRD